MHVLLRPVYGLKNNNNAAEKVVRYDILYNMGRKRKIRKYMLYILAQLLLSRWCLCCQALKGGNWLCYQCVVVVSLNAVWF